MVRHDLFGWHYPREGFTLEQNVNGDLLIWSNGPYHDAETSWYYSSVLGMERFAATGACLAQDTVFDPTRATYVGFVNCSTMLPDGRFVVSGSTYSSDEESLSALFWFDQDGSLLRRTDVQPTPDIWITYQHKNTADAGFILTGGYSVPGSGQQDGFLLKTDSMGQVVWWHNYGDPTRIDWALSVVAGSNGRYYVGGRQLVASFTYATWVFCVDSLGALLWEAHHGPPAEYVQDAQLIETQDGNLVFATNEFIPPGTSNAYRAKLAKLDPDGSVLWSHTYGDPGWDTGFQSVAEHQPTGDLLACGLRTDQMPNGFTYYKGIVARTTSAGELLWMRELMYYDTLMSDCEGFFRDIQPTADNGCVAVGTVGGCFSGEVPGLSQDTWWVKLDSAGCLVPGCDLITGIESQVTNLREALRVWPNPAASGSLLNVELMVPEALRHGTLRLSLISAQGRLVQEGTISGNTPLTSFQLGPHAPGLYFLDLSQGERWLSATKLMLE